MDFEPNDQIKSFHIVQFTFYLQVVHFQGFSTTNDKSRLIRVCNKKKTQKKPPQNPPKNLKQNKDTPHEIAWKNLSQMFYQETVYSYNQKDSKQGIDTRRRTDLSGF